MTIHLKTHWLPQNITQLQIIFTFQLFLKAVNSIDGDVRVSKRVYIPSNRLRGFEAGKVIQDEQHIGGNYGAALNFTSSFQSFNEFENLDFSSLMLNLWHVDYDSLWCWQNKIFHRLAVDWFTAIGPLSFSYAIPITDATTDKTESFRFQIGTSFWWYFVFFCYFFKLSFYSSRNISIHWSKLHNE